MKRTPMKRRPKSEAKFKAQYGSKERVAWVKNQPSVVSGDKPCDNAHVRTGGMGMKAGPEWIVPLTHAEHTELDDGGRQRFERVHRIDLDDAARETDRRWKAYLLRRKDEDH